MKHLSLAVLFFVLSVAPILGQGVVDSKNELPKDLELAESWIHSGGESGIRSRFLFMYLPDSSFSEKNLSLIFAKYQKEYCDPYILNIDIYSDKVMLNKRIKFEKNPPMIDFANNDAGRKAENELYEKLLGPASGYHQARYARYGKYEFFDFTPDKNRPQQTRVLIADPDHGQPNRNVCLATQKR